MFINKLSAFLMILLLIGDSFGQDSLRNEKGDSRLVVKSNPSGAKVIIDNVTVGVTPFILKDIKSGQHSVTVALNDTVKEDNVVYLHKEEKELFFILDGEYALLNFSSDPNGAQVFIDDSLYGVTPLQNIRHSTGLAKMELVKPNYDTVSQTLRIIKMKYDLLRKMEYKYGYMTISTAAPDLKVVFDGEELSENSFVNQRMPKGIHQLELSTSDFHKSIKSEIAIPSNTQNNIVFKYNYLTTKYLFESALLPGLGQFEDQSQNEGAIYFFGVILPAALCIKASLDYTKQIEDYNREKEVYSKALTENDAITSRSRMESLLHSVNKSIDIKNISLGIAVGFYLINLVDAVIFHMRDGAIEVFSKPMEKVIDGNVNEIGIKIKL